MPRRLAIVGLTIAGLVPTGPADATPVDTTAASATPTATTSWSSLRAKITLSSGDRRGSSLPTTPSSNFLQLSDFQIVDEESPARVEFLDTTRPGDAAPDD